MMAEEKDQTLVKVNLSQQRHYRTNDSDAAAVAVGPGEADVPKWVVDHWLNDSSPQSAATVTLVDSPSLRSSAQSEEPKRK
jgi:hypothetical protein